MAKTTPAKSMAPVEFGLLLYPGAQAAAVHGLTDLIGIADRIAREQATTLPALRVSHWRLDDGGKRVERGFDTHQGDLGSPAFVIVPPALGVEPLPTAAAAPLAAWLRQRHESGAVLASVCAGAFLLAETGLLAGRSVTTHWNCSDALARRFPHLRVHADKLLIDDGDILTAGGLMAWTDLGLRLVERLLGAALMLETARFMLIDPPGREQRYYSAFTPQLQHGDNAVLKVQRWLQSRTPQDITLTTMAAQAQLQERTFQRRFHKATGLKPMEYLQHLRVAKARVLLELGQRNLEEVAWAVGYQDPGAFRKVFLKVVGLTPAAYRQRFGTGA